MKRKKGNFYIYITYIIERERKAYIRNKKKKKKRLKSRRRRRSRSGIKPAQSTKHTPERASFVDINSYTFLSI